MTNTTRLWIGFVLLALGVASFGMALANVVRNSGQTLSSRQWSMLAGNWLLIGTIALPGLILIALSIRRR